MLLVLLMNPFIYSMEMNYDSCIKIHQKFIELMIYDGSVKE